jgi:hypothetical protein
VEADRIANDKWVERAARFGLAAKGVLYLLVGGLAILVAVGAKKRVEDREGALQTVADQPFGKVLLLGLAAGLAGYAGWRLVQAFLDRNDDGDDAKGLAKRGGYLARAVWYGGLCAITLSIVLGADEKRGSRKEDRLTSWVLDLPAGKLIVGAVGAGILGAGLYNGYRAVSLSFRKHLRREQMSEEEEAAATVLGTIGHAARLVIFALIGLFLVRAAWEVDPKETVGLGGALSEVLQHDGGRIWMGAIAAGLLAYGLYCFVQARYRDV